MPVANRHGALGSFAAGFSVRARNGMAAAIVFCAAVASSAGKAGEDEPSGDAYPTVHATAEMIKALSAGRPAGMAVPYRVGDPLPLQVALTREQVAWLARRVDGSSRAANRLKAGYFRAAWPGRWPVGEALAFLENELRSVTPTSPRGLQLQAVIAYGRAVTPPNEGWQAAYRQLWEKANALARHPALLREAVDDYLDVARPGSHRVSRATVGEVRFFLEEMLPRWFSIEDEDDTTPDWGGLARLYDAEVLLWRLVDAAERTCGDRIAFRLRAAKLALATQREGRRVFIFAPDRALAHLDVLTTRGDVAAWHAARRATVQALRGEAFAALDRWDDALDAYGEAISNGGERLPYIRCAQAAASRSVIDATGHASNRDKDSGGVKDHGERAGMAFAASYKDKRDAMIAAALAEDVSPSDQLAVARFLSENGLRVADAAAVLDRLMARDDYPAALRRDAALARLAAAARANDRDAGRRADALFRNLSGKTVPLLESMLAAAYRKKLAL